MNLPIVIELPGDLVAAEEYPSYAQVYFRGEADDIFSISESEIQIVADFSDYSAPGLYRVALSARKMGRAEDIEPLEIRVEPGMLTLPLEERVGARIEVIGRTSGTPASGYELVSYSVVPSHIRVYGPRSEIEALSELYTADVELQGQQGNFASRVPVMLPSPLLHFSDIRIVEFRAEISESILVNTFENIPVTVLGLDPRFAVDLQGLTGSIRAQASQSLIGQTSRDVISLAVYADSIEREGSYMLPVRPLVPRGFVIFRFDPVELVLDVTLREGAEEE